MKRFSSRCKHGSTINYFTERERERGGGVGGGGVLGVPLCFVMDHTTLIQIHGDRLSQRASASAVALQRDAPSRTYCLSVLAVVMVVGCCCH